MVPFLGLEAFGYLIASLVQRRLSAMEQKVDTERNVTLAALRDLESRLAREALDREQSVQVAARAVLATHRAAANASAGATIAQLSRERGGALSAEDLTVAFHRLGVGVGSAEADFVVKALDLDGSGSIDGSELEYLGSTAQDIINLAAHVQEEVRPDKHFPLSQSFTHTKRISRCLSVCSPVCSSVFVCVCVCVSVCLSVWRRCKLG